MTNLNIQQGLNIEIVSANIIKKLYEAALSVPEPLEGELDDAYMSGNLLVDKTYRTYVSYLTTRFPDLHINVTDSYYIPFEDSNVLSVLMANNISSDGIGITEADAANANLGTILKGNTTITSFDEFKYFTRANTSPVTAMFAGCTNLSSIDLSETTAFSSQEFNNAAITDVNAPNLTTVPNGSSHIFTSNQSLLTITSLGHITRIPGDMCWACGNLQSVIIPAECVEIQGGAFYPYNVTGHLQTVTGLENVASFGYRCFRDLWQLLLTARDLAGAVSVEGNAFTGVKVSSINSPKLMTLGEDSFSGNTALTTIECLGKVSNIPSWCFSRDSSLLTVKLPYECTTIGDYAFYGCSSLTSIKQYADSIDDWVEGEEPTTGPLSRVTSFGLSCFEGCSLLSLTPQDIQNATTIGLNAFRNCSNLAITINLPNLTSLGLGAFYNTSISSVSSLGSVTEIGERVFEDTNISSITIPNSVKKCACNIVSDTSVPEIIFPEGVEKILGGQFLTKNNSLTYIEIPSTVTNMDYFFHRSLETSSDNLCTLVIKTITPPELTYFSNNSLPTNGVKFAGIYVPDSSLTAYQNGGNAWLHSSIQAKLKPISQLLTDNPTAWAKYNRTSTV